ncbi:hypothetical protein HGA13_29305 [Nocardia speluncae]|uniref:YbaB/EbfC DNA-binding family protein n=1 Tax=Nocardia speluncae TaxID=419477 RepID=A0A846XNJ3_9NOCA|nr:hypothetical protein [Nocardia speluncae]NKY37137.1 hypothetical protein [Nocardia speluncae]
MSVDSPGSLEFPTEFTAHSRTGSVRIRTTETGLPVGVSVEPGELRRDPEALAGEILRLCRKSAARAGLVRRKQLQELGFTSGMLKLAGLPTEDQVAREELVQEQEYETETESWLRSV